MPKNVKNEVIQRNEMLGCEATQKKIKCFKNKQFAGKAVYRLQHFLTTVDADFLFFC